MGGCKNIEVLCATMHQNDFSNYYAMNIHDCDVIFANQSDEFSYQEMTVGANSVKMLTTTTRGVGKNRNLALVMASSEILLLADDDLTYEPDMPQMVSAGFQCFPDADMIVFGTKYMKNGNVYKCRKPKSKRLSFSKHFAMALVHWLSAAVLYLSTTCDSQSYLVGGANILMGRILILLYSAFENICVFILTAK